ncbi:MAG: hypothetical protein J7M18_07650, partial [Candidatus Eremiobacteraeota bacterium]|nr:hypothetical protein [Candidatus Eremiobacteraeota bacterium]
MGDRDESIEKYLEEKVESLLNNMSENFDESTISGDSAYIPILATLYFYEMHHKVSDPMWAGRDHLIVSDLDCLPYLFGVLSEYKYLQWKRCESTMSWARKNLRSHSLMITLPGISGICSKPLISAMYAN